MSDPNDSVDQIREMVAELKVDLEKRGMTGGTQEKGRRVVTIPRPYDGDEVRIILQNYKGNPVTQIGLWRIDEAKRAWILRDEQYWVRRSEILPVIEGLTEVLRILRDEWNPDEGSSTMQRET